jgi:hypothetical protein
MNECPVFTTALRESGSLSGRFMGTATKMFSESVLTATVLDRRRDLLAVYEPTLILNSTMMNVNSRRQRTYHTLARELVTQRNENFIPKCVRNTGYQRSKYIVPRCNSQQPDWL